MNSTHLFFNEPSCVSSSEVTGVQDTFLGHHPKDQEQAFADYDRGMAAAAFSADLQDHYYGYQDSSRQNKDDREWFCDPQEDSEYMEVDSEYYDDEYSESGYSNDSLLSLILGVQTYLNEAADNGHNPSRDSPLFELQYKMYTYMKQCACEMGYDVSAL